MNRRRAPILIERELLLDHGNIDAVAIEKVVALQRRGHHVLLLAEQPHRWRPTRRSVDHDLALQQEPLEGLLAPEALDALASARGWTVTERLSPEQQRDRWLAGRTDTLAVPDFAWLARLRRA